MFNKIRTKIKSVFTKEQMQASHLARTGNNNYGSGSKFPQGNSRNASINIHNHFSIRQKVRDMMYDSVECRSLVNSKVDMIIDNGLRLKPVPIPEILGITPEQAEIWAEDVAQRFHLYAKSKKSHRSRVNNLYQNQRLWQLASERDNDVFLRFYYGRDKDLVNPLQIEFVDPNQIRGYAYTSSYTQQNQNDGINRDRQGREISYKVWNYDTEGKYSETVIPVKGEKSGRIFMIHGFSQEYAGQGRGMSKLAHLIQELENLTDFKFSVLQKAINQASFMAAIENDQQDASNPLEGRVARPVRDYGSTSQILETQSSDVETPIINWSEMPEATIHQPGSTLVGNLRKGDKFINLKDTSPSPQFDSFVNNIFTFIAASVGWASEVVLKKFSNSYSASRGILILIYRKIKIDIDETTSDFLEPLYEMWLSEEIASGRILAPGWSDKLLREAWVNAEWSGSPLPSIDPAKTAKADKEYILMGAQTPDDVARNYNGSSGKANRTKNARQFEELTPWPFSDSGSTEPVDENKIDEKIEEDKNDE